jgi:hypothetical protein
VAQNAVPWYSKFSGSFPPYNNDQHPFLVWNMYRVANGAIQQIGASGMKHAFLTINSNCLQPGERPHPGRRLRGRLQHRQQQRLQQHRPAQRLIATAASGSAAFHLRHELRREPQQRAGFNGAGDPRLVVTDADLGVAGATYFFGPGTWCATT